MLEDVFYMKTFAYLLFEGCEKKLERERESERELRVRNFTSLHPWYKQIIFP